MNKRLRHYIVSILGKESSVVTSYRSAICLYKKYCKMYPNDLLCIQEIYVFPDLIDYESSSL